MRLIFVALLWIGTFSASNKLILCCMMMRFVPAVRSQFNVSKNAIVRRKKKKTIYVFSKALVIWSFISFLRVWSDRLQARPLHAFAVLHDTTSLVCSAAWIDETTQFIARIWCSCSKMAYPAHLVHTTPAQRHCMRWPYIRISLLRSSSLNQVCIRLTTTHKPSPSPSQLVLWVNRSSTHTTQHSTHKFTAFPFINKVVSYLPFIMVTKDKHRQQQKKKTNEKKHT